MRLAILALLALSACAPEIDFPDQRKIREACEKITDQAWAKAEGNVDVPEEEWRAGYYRRCMRQH
jgi:hypothetical protein